MSDHDDAHDQHVGLLRQPNGAATPASGRRRTTGRRIAAVATGTTIALGAGGIAWAATSTPTPTPSTTSSPADPYAAPGPEGGAAPDGDGGPAWRGGGHGAPGGMPFGFGMPLHGEQVVETSEGVYATIATQRGTVDAVSADSLTVTSEDGFVRTYVLTADSLVDEHTDQTAALAVGDEVMVVATLDGTEATVTRAVNVTALPTPAEGATAPHGRPDGGATGGPEGSGRGELPSPQAPRATPGATTEGSTA